jgi:23S rRNA pseudouridine1911/1915/1917 synthase
MTMTMIEILYEDNHCLAVNKPAGLLTQGDASGDPCALELARADIKVRHGKPGNVFLGLVHRLDRPVSGVLLFARTSKAASRLSAEFREGTARKVYWAWVEGRVPDDAGRWVDRLEKDASRNVSRVVSTEADDMDEVTGEDEEGEGRLATLSYRVLERSRDRSLVELTPGTGRSHQLRVQLASRGLPIVGDRKYGARSSLVASDGGWRIALHALRLSVRHPTKGEAIAFEATVPADWPPFAPR